VSGSTSSPGAWPGESRTVPGTITGAFAFAASRFDKLFRSTASGFIALLGLCVQNSLQSV
jgi:hypothetical protein